MATLLIGGNGLVGTRLVRHLSEMGEQVIVYSGHAPAARVDGCVYYQGDVTEYGTLNQVLHEHPVDRIIHNAAVSHPKLFLDNPYRIYRTNVTGTLVSLDTVPETVPLHGESPYGASKVACEELVRNYGLDSASLRVGFVYGPGRKLECPIQLLLNGCIRNGYVHLEHGAEQMMDYIYVDDCVDAIATIAMAKKLPHTEYNIGGGENVPYSRVIACVQKLYPNATIQVGSGTLGYDNLGAMDMRRAFADFGWRPKVTLEDGIAQYAKWLEEQG